MLARWPRHPWLLQSESSAADGQTPRPLLTIVPYASVQNFPRNRVPGVNHLARLFTPMTIGRMLVQNRIMMPGMSAGMMLDSDAQPTPEMIAYYVERAKTRPGLMAIGASAVVPAAAPRKMPLALDHDRAWRERFGL